MYVADHARRLARILPHTVVKHLPEWLRGMGFKRMARHGRRLGEEVVDVPFQFIRNRMRDGTACPSMALFNLQDLEDIDSTESRQTVRLIAGALGSLHAGRSI
ncbi:hypothetical protein BV25DRAFT_1832289 [Artomyces pyxidatus]|uniref:Uncharacterized protein n=1 Tax=Artomyces pyxidatus TaxID=48021 RepID=A0ACB8SJI9_9AGAM|nr:hypothetical protein BV25DRAFT_1832289 [Artomyces pyxidatus]